MESEKKAFKRKLFINSPKHVNDDREELVPGSLVLALQSKVVVLQNKLLLV